VFIKLDRTFGRILIILLLS